MRFLPGVGSVRAAAGAGGLGEAAALQPKARAGRRQGDLRAVTVPAADKPSCFSLSSPHSSAFFLSFFFFLFNNPGCIFSLNQTICLLAFVSTIKTVQTRSPLPGICRGPPGNK